MTSPATARDIHAPRRAGEEGQVAIEFLGTIFLVLLAGLLAWQLALAGWSAVGAANAARTAARAYSRTGDAGSGPRWRTDPTANLSDGNQWVQRHPTAPEN